MFKTCYLEHFPSWSCRTAWIKMAQHILIIVLLIQVEMIYLKVGAHHDHYTSTFRFVVLT
jgi:hypothetical protein